jgi:ATP-dependent DNA helicase MPH1
MNSDDYFDGEDDFDASALQQLDAIEAANFSPQKQSAAPATSPLVPTIAASSRPPLGHEASFGDLSFDFDERNLAQLDNFIEDAIVGKAQPVAGPSKPTRTTSGNMLQRTLFGDVLPPPSSNKSSSFNKPRPQMERTKSVQNNPFGQQAPKTKSWDQTVFSKTGIQQSKKRANKKGKGKTHEDDAEDSDEEQVEFEQFPAPVVNGETFKPLHILKITEMLFLCSWVRNRLFKYIDRLTKTLLFLQTSMEIHNLHHIFH